MLLETTQGATGIAPPTCAPAQPSSVPCAFRGSAGSSLQLTSFRVWWGNRHASHKAHITDEETLSNGSDMVRTHSCVFLPSAAVIKKLHFHLFSHFCPLPASPPGTIQHESQISDRTFLASWNLGTSPGHTRVMGIGHGPWPELLMSIHFLFGHHVQWPPLHSSHPPQHTLCGEPFTRLFCC